MSPTGRRDTLCERLEPVIELEGRRGHLSFPSILAVDGSTLEELRKKTDELKSTEECVPGGKIIVMVELFGLRPVWVDYTEEPNANDKRFSDQGNRVL